MHVLVLVEQMNTLFDRTGSVGLVFSLLQFYVFSCRCCMMIIMKRVSKISMNRKANKIRYNGMTMVMVDDLYHVMYAPFSFFLGFHATMRRSSIILMLITVGL
uniref:Uncharacterized protein n=1 Tax=Triticum urartu TaxID=4572 RepID=A0A8R7PIF6_TRIUA